MNPAPTWVVLLGDVCPITMMSFSSAAALACRSALLMTPLTKVNVELFMTRGAQPSVAMPEDANLGDNPGMFHVKHIHKLLMKSTL